MATKDSKEWLKARVEKAKEALALPVRQPRSSAGTTCPAVVAGETTSAPNRLTPQPPLHEGAKYPVEQEKRVQRLLGSPGWVYLHRLI